MVRSWEFAVCLALSACTTLASLHGEEPTIARFGGHGELLAIQCGNDWVEMTGTITLSNKVSKSSTTLTKSGAQEKVVDGKTIWSATMKPEGGVPYDVTQTVWREDGKLQIDVLVKPSDGNSVVSIYLGCVLPLNVWAGGRFKCGAAEGALPTELKPGNLVYTTSKTKPLSLIPRGANAGVTLTFSENAAVRLRDGRTWKKEHYWLTITLQDGSLPAGRPAHLRLTIAPDAAADTPERIDANQQAESPVAADPAPSEPQRPPSPPREPQPIPDEKSQQDAEVLVRDFFKTDYASTGPEARAALAKRLLSEAYRTNTDMDLKFALLKEARSAALDGGHVALALRVIDDTGDAFVFDTAQEKSVLLEQLSRTAKTPEAARNVADACLDMAAGQLAANQFDNARSLLTQAEAAARSVKDDDWLKDARRRIKDMQDELREYDHVASSFQKLAAEPEDPAANTAVGRFLCFARNDWAQGLPRLVGGSDAELKKLAQEDLAAPADAVAQAALGERWYDYGKRLSGKARFIAQDHAVQWLQKALPGLDEEKQAQVGKTLVAFYTAGAEQGMTGASFQLGNVALSSQGAKLSRVGEGGTLTPDPAAHMLDGVTTGYTGESGFTYRSFPCAWVVTLPKAYVLQEIRLLLWDGEDRYYRYLLETSMDGKDYQLVADCSKGEFRSWQSHSFPPRLARFIRLKGLYNSANSGFHVVELEAYCVPPSKPATPKYPSSPKGSK